MKPFDASATSREPRGTNGPSRRIVLKGGAAALAASTVFSPAVVLAADPVIKIGHVSPRTGPMAGFAEADPYMIGEIRKYLAKGLKLGGKTYKIEIITKDSQTDTSRAAEVASELILKDKVDIITAASGSIDTNPVADAAELNEVPCVTTDNPWESYYYGRNPGKEGFTWTYHFFWGLAEVLQSWTGLWESQKSNKIVGTLFNNGQDDNSWHNAFIPYIKKAGFKVVDPGQFPAFGNDFTPQIAAFKNGNVEIVTGNLFTPDFGTFWQQCAQQGYKPKIVTIGKAFLFPSAIESLGPRSAGVTSEMWWSPHHPFKSSLTGESAKQLCDAYEKTTHRPWTQPIGFKHALFEVVIDVLKRSSDVKDPKAILAAIKSTNIDTIVGHVQWTGKPVKNVCTTPVVTGQWQYKNKKWDLEIVGNKGYPNIPVTSKLLPLA
jgi:branched-chain amino acid transport system substrate-binding protein